MHLYSTLHYTFMKYEKFQFHLDQIISQIGINQQMKLINNKSRNWPSQFKIYTQYFWNFDEKLHLSLKQIYREIFIQK